MIKINSTDLDGNRKVGFKLLKTAMVEIEETTTTLGPYRLMRAELKKGLKIGTDARVLYYIGQHLVDHFPALIVLGRGFVQIGCQTFRGEDARKLLAWAKAK
jgi:hypothetical protein